MVSVVVMSAHPSLREHAHLLLLVLAALQHGLPLRILHYVAVGEEPLQTAMSSLSCQGLEHAAARSNDLLWSGGGPTHGELTKCAVAMRTAWLKQLACTAVACKAVDGQQ